MEEFADTINRCVEANKSGSANRELDVIRKISSESAIKTLTVRDFNTEGLKGGDYEDGSWHRLVRAIGSNDPSGVGGGSYGLGKGAPFAASGIRTVFYATFNDKGEHVFQGKTRLVTHRGKDGKWKRGVGFYGIKSEEACRSIRNKNDIPSDFLRNERGTDIIIPAYKAVSDNWQLGLVHSVLKNFWPAIHEQMLEVEIYNEDQLSETINSENLQTFLEYYPGEETGNAYYYYLAKTNPDNDGHFAEHIDGLGEVELYVKRGDDFPKKVQQMRKPLMVVASEPYRRSLLDPYAAVLICKDDEGNDFLKSLEPPQHDTWDPTLGEDPKRNKRIYKSLQNWVRDRLKSLSQAYDGELAEVPGLADYLASAERDDNMPFGRRGKSDEEPNEETSVERPVPISVSAVASQPQRYSYKAVKADPGPNQGGGGGNGGEGGGNSGGGKPRSKGKARAQSPSPIRVRNIGMTTDGQFTDVELCLYSDQPFTGSIQIIATGEDMNSGVRVIHAHTPDGVGYLIKSGRILNIRIDPARPTIVTARIEGKNIRYALGVESHENNS